MKEPKSTFIHPQNVGEVSDLFLLLSEKIYAIKEKHVPGKSMIPDARRMGLMNCYQFITSNVFIMNIINGVVQGRISSSEFKKLIFLEEGDLQKVLNDIFITTKISILPPFLFQIENMLRNILRHIKPEAKANKYYTICQDLLSCLSVDQKEHKLAYLQIPAKIRNSLHSNGIYEQPGAKEALIYSIKNVEYKFENGKIINCGGPGHIYLALDNTLNIINEILDSPEISAIKIDIKDHFAWENKGLV